MSGPRMKIDFARLADWVEGRLSEEEARAVKEQVAVADSATLADVAWLRKFARAAGGAALESPPAEDRKSTRLNSSHANISYAVFCLKKKKTTQSTYALLYTK